MGHTESPPHSQKPRPRRRAAKSPAHTGYLPLPTLALVRPRPILAVGFLHKGIGVLGLGGPPGETLFQLVLQEQARQEVGIRGKGSEPRPS